MVASMNASRTSPIALRNTHLRDDGVFEANDTPVERLSLGQRVFFHKLSARLYVISREGTFARLLNGHASVEDYPWLVNALELEDDSIVLDVPCGQGNVTEAIARVLPRGRVIALDLSNTMLDLARRRLKSSGLQERAILLRANAQQLPLEDASVDAVSACAGLHLFPDPDRAISEMRRVLRPGGRVGGLVFVKQTDMIPRLVQAAVRRVSGMIAFDFDELGRRFEAHGFTDWQWHRAGIVGYFQARAA
jgi:SAM-dependent methyltransferase